MTVRLLSKKDSISVITKSFPLIPKEELESTPDEWKQQK